SAMSMMTQMVARKTALNARISLASHREDVWKCWTKGLKFTPMGFHKADASKKFEFSETTYKGHHNFLNIELRVSLDLHLVTTYTLNGEEGCVESDVAKTELLSISGPQNANRYTFESYVDSDTGLPMSPELSEHLGFFVNMGKMRSTIDRDSPVATRILERGVGLSDVSVSEDVSDCGEVQVDMHDYHFKGVGGMALRVVMAYRAMVKTTLKEEEQRVKASIPGCSRVRCKSTANAAADASEAGPFGITKMELQSVPITVQPYLWKGRPHFLCINMVTGEAVGSRPSGVVKTAAMVVGGAALIGISTLILKAAGAPEEEEEGEREAEGEGEGETMRLEGDRETEEEREREAPADVEMI
ncbi:hypothetical protein KIPB_009305, partial [Kipferlia bialata]